MNKKVVGGILQSTGIMIGGGLGGLCAWLGILSYPALGLLPFLFVVGYIAIGLLLFVKGRNMARSEDMGKR